MPEIFDTGALVRPAFDDAQFTPTRWSSAADKATFANALCRFVAADCPRKLFTKALYDRLSLTFGHIAHYNLHGFFETFFADTSGKVAFLEETMTWACFGDPASTYCDVERAIIARLRACDLLNAYRRRHASEQERAERALLHTLQSKYRDPAEAAQKATPLIVCSATTARRPAPVQPPAQASLL